jgi:hypothetical protein
LARLTTGKNQSGRYSNENMIPAALAMTLLSASGVSGARADDSSSYVEGTVTQVTSIRTKPGKFDAYMKWLDILRADSTPSAFGAASHRGRSGE